MNNEQFPSPESQKQISRAEVVGAYQKFIERGITNPDALDSDDPEVKEVNDLVDRWQQQEDARTGDDAERSYRSNLTKTMLHVDAGFRDPEYLRDVLGWLVQDADSMEKQPANPERVETRQQITEAIRKIRTLLVQIEH